jgi:hypothetical protein
MSDTPRSAAEVFRLRKSYAGNGYRPVAIYTGQKHPRGDGWRVSALQDPPLWAESYPEDVALSTGILTGAVVAADVDILIQAITDRVVWDIEQTAGPTPLVRIGLAPKTLMTFRCEAPFSKLSTGIFIMPDGSEAKVEILADGQQFVADGIHPDTGQAYLWVNASPDVVPLSDLPTLSLEQARGIVERARALIVANGGVLKEKPKKERQKSAQPERSSPPPRKNGHDTSTAGSDFFANVNVAALANLDDWVRKLFPKAVHQSGTGAWRVASADRGRPDLEEDISLHPDGIQDFGLEYGLTAIDTVIEHGAVSDAIQAALWLCERLGIAPETLGWRPKLVIPGPLPPGAGPGTASGPTPSSGNDLIWDAGDDSYDIPPRGWLLGSIFCRQFLSSLLADGGVGKTAVRLAQLISLAIGRSLTGEYVFQRCKVLVVSLEDSRNELRRRVCAILRHYKLTPADVKGWLFLAAPKGLRLAEMQYGAPAIGALKAILEDAIRTRGIDIISLDPFVKSHGLPENSNDAIDWVCTLIAEMAIEHDVAFDSPHHTSKAIDATPGNANRGRGATAHKDAGRLVYTLTPMTREEAEQFGQPEIERRSLIRMDSAKVNIAPPAADAKWFKLVSVPLGNVTPQYPNGDHVQVAEPWAPSSPFGDLDLPTLEKIFAALRLEPEDGWGWALARGKYKAANIVAAAAAKTGKQAATILQTWKKNEVLREETYTTPTNNGATRIVLNEPLIAELLAPLRGAGAAP